MAIRITKSELRQMVREALKEELTKISKDRKHLKESTAVKSASSIIKQYDDNVTNHILELKHEKAFSDADWYETEWYALEDVKVGPDYYTLVMNRPVESLEDAELIINYAFDNVMYSIEDAMMEGGVVQDEGSNEIYVEGWVVD